VVCGFGFINRLRAIDMSDNLGVYPNTKFETSHLLNATAYGNALGAKRHELALRARKLTDTLGFVSGEQVAALVNRGRLETVVCCHSWGAERG
jgi:hypothetical protein